MSLKEKSFRQMLVSVSEAFFHQIESEGQGLNLRFNLFLPQGDSVAALKGMLPY